MAAVVHPAEREQPEMTTATHSPLPWTAQGLVVVALRADKLVCFTSTTDKEIDEARANAAFIARAVNAHAALVEACRVVLQPLTTCAEAEDRRLIVRAALALATGNEVLSHA